LIEGKMMIEWNRAEFRGGKMAGFVLLAAMSWMVTGNAAAAKSPPPNVLFIAVDDLNDWTGFLGGHPQAKTPNMDRLADRSMVFANNVCAAPICGPSRTSLMYGIAPYKSGSYGHDKKVSPPEMRIAPSIQPLNLLFQNNGYYTAGIGKIFHFKESRGWDHWDKSRTGKTSVLANGSINKNTPISMVSLPFNRWLLLFSSLSP
jgi:hypothetical protein